ncbi:MAG TPA: glycoside hydrolase family 20 zincin-like fold domain-containing protein [Bryobacteraceae bacterium]|nr:glycoside hydrolase family 20 zincin-like fold domain-containing protein [Bryobacteraceae bacterium]
MPRFLTVAFVLITAVSRAQTSPLLSRGYAVIPEPRQVKLEPIDFDFPAGWSVQRGQGVGENSVAIEELRSRLRAPGSKVVQLEISPGSVNAGPAQDRDSAAIAEQAYRLELSPSRVRIIADADTGLFYGVETLLQLANRGTLPAGEITDWPDLRMRQIYWDDAHHLERLPELKRALRQAAFFKINGFAIKLEGHFEYHSAPAVVEPYALSPAELQELTDYGLRYHVQLIPYLDGPAHIAFILKHPEYAKLRAFPDSNYELCMTNPDSYKLMEGMFGDLLAANKGVQYIYLSTDEPYYSGMADNAQCNETNRAKELGSNGRVLAEFITKVGSYLHDRGRTVVIWGEFPLKPSDIGALPPWIINGETYGPDFDSIYRAHGIRQMIYTSTEGEEKLFPDYFIVPPPRNLHAERGGEPRVAGAVRQIQADSARRNSDLIGLFVAGWADMGLHPETFWLGYATIPATGWNPTGPDPRELMSEFYPLFYGRAAAENMDRIYQLMSYQAQLWNGTWDGVDSTARKPIWGYSEGIYKPPRPAHDQAIPLPGAPGVSDLAYDGNWSRENARRLDVAETAVAGNDELLGLLYAAERAADSNRYNLEVFISIAQLCRQNLRMIEAFGQIDRSLSQAQSAAQKNDHADAVAAVDRALDAARRIRDERNTALRGAVDTWYKSWLPRTEEANGRRFLHELDDVKDHLPDRTVDMSYLVYRELLLPMDDWYTRVQSARNEYARAHDLPAREEPLNWKALN